MSTQQETYQTNLRCEKCGSYLQRVIANIFEPDEIVVCPVHGSMGRYNDFMKERGAFFAGQVFDALGDELQKAGIKFTKS